MMSRFSEMPPMEGMPIPDELKDKIMHMTLKIDEPTLLLGSDTGGEWGAGTLIGNNITLSIKITSKAQADDYLKSFLREAGLICAWRIPSGVPALECVSTNMISAGG